MKKSVVWASLLVGACQALGFAMEKLEQGKGALFASLPLCAAMGVLWAAGTALFFACARLAGRRLLPNVLSYDPQNTLSKGRFAAVWAVLFVSWVPCWLAYFPAIYSYDGEPQLIQYTTGAFDNHHPLLHTLFLGACYDLGRFLQDRWGVFLDGMAFYALVQMLFLSFSFTCGISFLFHCKVRKGILAAAVCWFALFPVHPLMAVTTTKDTFFSAFFLLTFLGLSRLVLLKGPGHFRERVLLFLSALGMMLLRKNGVYLAAGTCLVLVFAWGIARLKKREIARFFGGLFAGTALCVMTFVFCDAGLMAATGARQGEAAEALSIPIQQMARTFKSNQNSLTAKELESLVRYIPQKGLENYRPSISDGVKLYFNNEEFARDPAGFVRIWLSLLVKYPGSYGTAFLYHTMGSWYLTDTSHCMVYKDWWRDRTGYFITDAVPVFAGDFVRKENLCPRVRDFYEAIATDCIHQRFLPLRILFSPAFFCFCTAFCCLGLCLRRHSLYWIPALAELLYLATVVAGPCILVRYIYPFMVLLPFLAVLTLSGQNRVLETAFDT